MLSVMHAYSGALTILNSVHDSIYSIVGEHIVYTSQCTYTLCFVCYDCLPGLCICPTTVCLGFISK